jgi:hypothetical protein
MSSDAAGGLHDVETLRRPNPEVTNVRRPPGSAPERVLVELGMPPEEIQAILVAEDPRLVRRHLELHLERLIEELMDRRRTLELLERELADAALGRARPDPVQSVEAGGSSTEPSSRTVQNGLCATSQGWPSGSTNTPE